MKTIRSVIIIRSKSLTFSLFPLVLAMWGGVLTGPLQGQPRLAAGQPAAGMLPLSWKSVSGRMYRLQTSATLQSWGPLPQNQAAVNPLVAPADAMALNVPISGARGFFRLSESLYVDPSWADVKPLRTVTFNYDDTLTDTENGALLRSVMLALIPGDRLVIGPGTYSINSFTNLSLQGTDEAPIRITSDGAGEVVITRPDSAQHVLNIGSSASHLLLQGLDITGGSSGLNLGVCNDVWINGCSIHHTADTAVLAVQNASRLFLTRNLIHHIYGSGNAITLGGSSGSVTDSVVGLNEIHNTGMSGVSQGFGINMKEGSSGNLVAGNFIHDVHYNCIFAVGGNGTAPNVVENNTCFGSGDYGILIGKKCVVRNNLVISGINGAFGCQAISGTNPTAVTVQHNTFISTGAAANLGKWSSGTGMIFSNNACYSRDAQAVNVVGGAGSTLFSGIVRYGTVTAGVPSTMGTGLADFVNVTWDGLSRDATPSVASPLRNAADPGQATEWDLKYFIRSAPLSSGAFR